MPAPDLVVIRDTHVLPTHGAAAVPHATVVVQGGIVAAIAGGTEGVSLPPSLQARVIDGRGTVCLPGLINCHNHVAMTLLRGWGSDLPLQRWLEEAIWPAEARLTDEDVLAGALLGCVEMARGGTTAFADMYDHMDAVAEAVVQVGLRASLSRGVIGQGRDWERAMAEAADFCRRHGAGRPRPGEPFAARGAGAAPVSGSTGPREDRPPGGDGPGREGAGPGSLISTMLAPHAEYTCPLPVWEQALRLARELGVPIHTHVSETQAEVEGCRRRRGCSPVRFLYEVGVFEVGLLAAHCVHIDADDIALLARGEAAVSHNPVSNAKLGSGVAPLEELRAAGVLLGLGTDGAASTDSLSLWREMRAAAWLQKAVRRDAAAAPVEALLRMATAGGAAALRLPSGCGRLEVGAPADLILVDVTGPRHTPHPDLASAMVYGTADDDVRLTMVAGRIVMEQGEFPGIDHERLRADAAVRSRRLLQGV
jgi:5-methylthioadenosine/S-adenosylhomocysteine deaminase